jgi:predicted NBD/HSP70 family sugar kinase
MKRTDKATRKQLKSHNRELVLRAIYTGAANTRASLAVETGLAKPTVSELVNELLEDELVEEGGHGASTVSGGKRPRLLRFVPTARQVIAITVSVDAINGCLANLDGSIVARHVLNITENLDLPLLTCIEFVINALIVQLDAPLLCITAGVPGIVNNARGVVVSSTVLDWYDVALADYLQACYNTPVYIGNNTELTARAQAGYFSEDDEKKLVTVLVNHTVEIGIAVGKLVFHHGSNIDGLPLASGMRVSAIGWHEVRERAEELIAKTPDTMLADDKFSYLLLRHAIYKSDPAALTLLNEIAGCLAEIYAWVIGVVRPDQIMLAGSLGYIGNSLISSVAERLKELLPPTILDEVDLILGQQEDVSLLGAVANALQRELGIL